MTKAQWIKMRDLADKATPLEQQLREIKDLCDKATPGPWVDWYGGLCIDVTLKEYTELVGPHLEQGPPFRLPKKKENMQFIAESRTLVPKLAEALERLLAEIKRSTDRDFVEHCNKKVTSILEGEE